MVPPEPVKSGLIFFLCQVDDEDMQTEGIYLDDDDDLARVLEFDKGWYNVSEPPEGAVSLPLG